MKIFKKRIVKNISVFTLSIAMIMSFFTPAFAGIEVESGVDQTANSAIERTAELSYTLKDDDTIYPLDNDTKITDITKLDKLSAMYSFNLKFTEAEDGGFDRNVKAGDYYLINLPATIKVDAVAEKKYQIYEKGVDNKDVLLAEYEFITGEDSTAIKVTFAEIVDDRNIEIIRGGFKFDFNLNLEDWADGETKEVIIPIDADNNVTISATKPKPLPTTPNELVKSVQSYNQETRELVWKVIMKPDQGIWEGCTFTDKIDITNMEFTGLSHGKLDLTEGVDYTYDKDTGDLSYTIPEGRNKAEFQTLLIKTKVLPKVYASGAATNLENKVRLSGGAANVDIESNVATQEIVPNWISKKGWVVDGNRIKWTITVNSTKQSMMNAIVTDRMSDDLILDTTTFKVANKTVKVQTTDYTPKDDNEAYCTYDETSHLLKYYFPRGIDNATSATYSIEFISDVAKNINANDEENKYTNNASLEVDYIGGNGTLHVTPPEITTDGVGIPNLYVTKSGSMDDMDKRDGTIQWTIKTASNITNYGVSRVVDTLPDDQEYIPGTIYWGTTKIDENTRPVSAIINGQELIVNFHNERALDTQQTITFKTKIKTEIYGDNLTKRPFKNNGSASLYTEKNIANISTPLLSKDTSAEILVDNKIISKNTIQYEGGSANPDQNPRVNFTIDINSNRMPLKNVVISDDLNLIETLFKDSVGKLTTFKASDGVKWTYVAKSLKMVRTNGTADPENYITELIKNAEYNADTNTLTIPFGKDVIAEDAYRLTFAVELDTSQNEIFKKNGEIKCKGNQAEIVADGLKGGSLTSNITGNSPTIKNELLGKSGEYKQDEQQIIWTINLNQHKYTMKTNQVVDILPAGLTLDPTSVKLYENVIKPDGSFLTGDEVEAKGTLVANFNYDYILQSDPDDSESNGQYKLIATLPSDDTSYILRFATDVDNKMLGTQINNTAYYIGEEEPEKNANTGNVSVSGTAGGITTRKGSITVNKASSDTDAALEGAAFALYWQPQGKDDVFVRELTTNKNGQVIFRGLSLGENYYVKETKSPNGYKIDESAKYAFTVSASGGELAPVTFHNTPIKTGKWTLNAIKHLGGKVQSGQPFKFEVLDANDQVVLNGKTTTKLSDEDYQIDFSIPEGKKDPFAFSDEHTFDLTEASGTEFVAAEKTYRIREIDQSSTMPGYEFDSKVHFITIQAINVKGKDTLKIVVKDEKGNLLTDEEGNFITGKTPTFNNTYQADGKLQLSAEKVVIGHALKAGQFTFDLFEEGNTTPIQTVTNKDGVIANDQMQWVGAIDFKTINFDQTQIGTKTYIIKERVPQVNQKGGYQYDTSVYTITVEVSDNDDGTLTSQIKRIVNEDQGTITNPTKIVFKNVYTTTDVEVNIAAKKELTARDLGNEQFLFKLQQVDETNEAIGTAELVKNDKDGKITFANKVYTQSDIGKSFYYQISEIDDGQKGYTYDSSIYVMKIKVVDNDDGTLSTTKELRKDGTITDKEILFANQYKAQGSTEISAMKILDGKTLSDGQFSFTLQQVNALGKTIGKAQTVKNATDGTVKFAPIKYTESDIDKTYFYKVKEVNTQKPGYEYDNTIYTVSATIVDNGDGTLRVEKIITKPASAGVPENCEQIVFSNIYTATGKTIIQAEKVLTGKELIDGAFEFTLTSVDADGNISEDSLMSVKNDEEGNIIFPELTFTQEDINKEYYYKMSEKNAEKPGYKYDTAEYLVKVKITDEDDNGNLTVSQSITDLAGTKVEKMVFNNEYRANSSVSIVAKKVLIGDTLKDKQFRFELYEGDSDKTLQLAYNKVDGSIEFNKIFYTQDDIGLHTYILKEVGKQPAGYTYDTSIYTIEVNVTDNGDGTLSSDVNMFKSQGEKTEMVSEIVFKNTYTPIQHDHPDTSDNTPMIPLIMLTILSSATICLFRKRRRQY